MSGSLRTSRVSRIPSYCKQKRRGKTDAAYVVIAGKRTWLGAYGTRESRRKYAELIGAESTPGRPVPSADLTVSELVLAYLEFAVRYYRHTANHSSREYEQHRDAAKLLSRNAGAVVAREFGPKRLKAIRDEMIGRHLSRKHINQQVRRIVVFFRWGVEEELLPAATHQALAAVRSLRRGRSDAKESKKVRPVDAAVVEATLEQLPAVLVHMVRLQLLCGCRPGELLTMRPCDIDRGGQVWTYTPGSHKTEHHGHSRTIAIGPRGQEILLRYLARAAEAVCFETRASD